MGNHSTKKSFHNTPNFLDHVAMTPAGPVPPEVEKPPVLGSLSKVHRIVSRHKIKDRVKFLESIIRTHQPLIQAMAVTQKAFQQGVMEGIRQVAAADREREALIGEREREQKAAEQSPAETGQEVSQSEVNVVKVEASYDPHRDSKECVSVKISEQSAIL